MSLVPPLRHRSNARASSLVALRTRLERIKALADDLARELLRARETVIVNAMADVIKRDADAVVRGLKRNPSLCLPQGRGDLRLLRPASRDSNARTRH
jgi:hypothetical protein